MLETMDSIWAQFFIRTLQLIILDQIFKIAMINESFIIIINSKHRHASNYLMSFGYSLYVELSNNNKQPFYNYKYQHNPASSKARMTS